MNVDAALDELAFQVGLRLMGPDERRRLRISLARHPEAAGPLACDVTRLERLDDLIGERRPAETLQDRLDLEAAARAREASPFDPAFWDRCAARLTTAGFTAPEAHKLIDEVRCRVDLAPVYQEETETCSA